MEGWSFSICKKIVQGNIWMPSNAQSHVQVMSLILRFQKQSSFRKHMFENRNPLEQPISITMFRSLRVLLADDNKKKKLNDVNRLVTRKCINWFSVAECSRPFTNNLSICQLGIFKCQKWMDLKWH
ncbi:hypothetical protein RDI58_026419 [Solanum bulbocastanum]|uniref:Uncharacterized protein n=1 Tax=Solanum bulbocastanum TaxID=147425 RepID=A0AAN8T065_SOLBU